MKKKLFLAIPSLCLLTSCPFVRYGGSTFYGASSLPSEPVLEERSVTIKKAEFIYYNVYKDGEDNFILKDSSSYLRTYDLTFGVRFLFNGARAYDISKGKDGSEECEIMEEKEKEIAYSIISSGFEIAIDKSKPSEYKDVNIGQIQNWC